jgi:DNA polymerase
MAAQVRRDEHKMRAFVRFVRVSEENETRYVAWYAPDHLIVRRAAPFFADRFASMRWSILTPDESAHWDGHALSFTEGVPPPASNQPDDVEELWRLYYSAVFNPARLNRRAMLREMPLRRWAQLPEAALIPGLVRTARERTDRLTDTRTAVTAHAFVPDTDDLAVLRDAAAGCRGCRLHDAATQVVFGEGPLNAEIVVVGEQPGDAEDLSGHPFVGPAGEVLDRALAAAGIDRRQIYVTNAVKHFSFEPRGKWRIHRTPRFTEMYACRPWLEAELRILRPSTVVAMGATAARTLLGPQARVTQLRGRVLEGLAWAARVIVTVHPSAVLRASGEGEKYFEMLVSDLVLASAGRKA